MALDDGEHQPPGCFLCAACWSPIVSDISFFDKTHEIDIEFHEVSHEQYATSYQLTAICHMCPKIPPSPFTIPHSIIILS